MDRSPFVPHFNPRVALPAATTLRIELLAGIVVALALIPEAISFSLIAGVDPKLGLYASFTMAVTIAFVGGRPAMISAATGAMALVIVSLVRDHGAEYLLVAGILAGIIQIVLGVIGIARLMKFVPRAVMTGFVNALAILIFHAQWPYLKDVPVAVYVFAAAALAMIYIVPRFTRAVPAPLIAIIVVTSIVVAFGIDIPNVGDEGKLPSALPSFGLPDVPFTWDTLRIVLPFSIALAFVGLLESLLTAQLVDDITETPSNKHRESRGQGIANVVTGFLGGMPGCAMIGQTMINVGNGARTRLSTFTAGVVLLVLCVGLGDVASRIPMAALVAVMVFVSIATFDWNSVRPSTLTKMPGSETTVMLLTVVITVATGNLAIGVVAGVIAALLFFARHVSHQVQLDSEFSADGGTRTYVVRGELFFASDRELIASFDYANDPPNVIIDLSAAHVWDASAVAALDTVTARYTARNITVRFTGFNPRSKKLHDALSGVGAGTGAH